MKRMKKERDGGKERLREGKRNWERVGEREGGKRGTEKCRVEQRWEIGWC